MTRTRDQIIDALTAPGGPFEIAEQPVRGVTLRVYTTGPRTLRDVLLSTAQFADRDYLVYRGERWTFADNRRLVAGLATHLRDRYGVRKGDRVAIAMRNYPEWAFAFWACQALGAVAVPLNAWWTGAELAYALNDSGATALFADGERVERLQPELAGLRDLDNVVCVRGEEAYAGVHRWEDVLAALDPAAEMPAADIDPDDHATIMYTSGTTGVPKGAVGTHRNHCTNLQNTALLGAVNAELAAQRNPAPAATPAAQPSSLQTFPLFHVGGLSGLYINTAFGGKIVLQYKWDTAEALDLIEQERISALALVPTLLRRLLEWPDLHTRDLSSLGGISSGGAPVPADLITRIESDFERKVAPANGYGLTETTSAVIMNAADMYFDHPDSIGRPVPGTDVRIVEAGGDRELPAGEIGELWVKGPNVVRGYWNKPEATAEAFTGGWFHTGDLGYVDADGFVYVVDRLKDVVLRGGENVYCAEVEAVLYQHPAVYDAAVIGIPHASLGEEVAAVVQPREGMTVTEDDIRRYAAGRLADFKVPARVFVRPEPLPRNAAGKVLKRELREQVTAPIPVS